MAIAAIETTKLTVAHDRDAVEALEPLWERAVAGSGAPTEQPSWTLACCDTIERSAALRVMAVDGPEGGAVAPLVWRASSARLELVGESVLGEPMDFAFSEEGALNELAERVAAERRPIELDRVPADSPTIAAFRSAFRRGFVHVAEAAGTPTIDLDGWSDPESKMSSRRRSDMRRMRRRAEALGEVTADVLAPKAHEVPALLEEAIAIEQRSWKGREGSALASDERLREFFMAYGDAAAREGVLRLAFLRIGGRGAAMQVAAESGGRFWLLKVGYDEEFGRVSPGNLLMLETLRYAADRGLEGYELLGRAEPWTEAWTKELRPHVRLRAYPARPRAVPALARDGATLARNRWRRQGRPALRRAVRPALDAVTERASARYVAGKELADAVDTAERLARHDYSVTLCYWNGDEDAPAQVAGEYVAAAAELAARGLTGHVSAKAPAMRFDLAEARRAADAARDGGRRLHFDALEPESVDRTFELIAALRDGGPRLGTTLPGRWRRSVADAARVADLGLDVRVVKGQWEDPDDPGADLGAGFLATVDALAGLVPTVSVATHDVPLLRDAIGRLQAAGTAAEVELLYGLPLKPATAAARSLGVPVRVYVPYGTAWLPYAAGTALRNPRTLWWLARDTALRRRGVR